MTFRRVATAAVVGLAFVAASGAVFLQLRSDDVPPIDVPPTNGPTSDELPVFEALSDSAIEKSIDPEDAESTIVDEPELRYT